MSMRHVVAGIILALSLLAGSGLAPQQPTAHAGGCIDIVCPK